MFTKVYSHSIIERYLGKIITETLSNNNNNNNSIDYSIIRTLLSILFEFENKIFPTITSRYIQLDESPICRESIITGQVKETNQYYCDNCSFMIDKEQIIEYCPECHSPLQIRVIQVSQQINRNNSEQYRKYRFRLSLKSWILSLSSILIESKDVINILYLVKQMMVYPDLRSSEWLYSIIQLPRLNNKDYIFTNIILDIFIAMIYIIINYQSLSNCALKEIQKYDENISIIFNLIPLESGIKALFYETKNNKITKFDRFSRIYYLIQMIGKSFNKYKECPLTSSILLRIIIQISNNSIYYWKDSNYPALILWLILYYILPSNNYYITNVQTLSYFSFDILSLDISYEILYDYLLSFYRISNENSNDNNNIYYRSNSRNSRSSSFDIENTEVILPNEFQSNIKYSSYFHLLSSRPEIIASFVNHIIKNKKDYNNTIFLLLSKLSINQKETDYYFIIVHLLYYICYISPITKNQSIDVYYINNLLRSMLNIYNNSETIEFFMNLVLTYNFANISNDLNSLIKSIHYINWKPSEELLGKLLEWLENDNEIYRNLAFHILSHLNWLLNDESNCNDENEFGKLFIPSIMHRRVAIAIGISDAKYNYYKGAKPIKDDLNMKLILRLTLLNPPKEKQLPLLFWETNGNVDSLRDRWYQYSNNKTDRLEEVCHSPSLAYVILTCTDYSERKGWMPLAILLQSTTSVAGYKIVIDCIPILTSKLLATRSLISDARMALPPEEIYQCYNELAFLHRLKILDNDKFMILCNYLKNPGHRQHIKEAQEQLRKYFQTLSSLHLALLNFPNIQHFLCINGSSDIVDPGKEKLLIHLISLQLYYSFQNELNSFSLQTAVPFSLEKSNDFNSKIMNNNNNNIPILATEHVIGFWMERIRSYQKWYINNTNTGNTPNTSNTGNTGSTSSASTYIFKIIDILTKAAIYSKQQLDRNEPLQELCDQLYCIIQPFLYNNITSTKKYPSLILKSDSWGKLLPILNTNTDLVNLLISNNYASFIILYMETLQEYDLYQYFGKVMCNNMIVHDIDQLGGKLINHYTLVEPDIKISAPSLFLHKHYDNFDEFRIYTWAQYIILYSYDSPLFPLICQIFFILYFSSSSHKGHSRYYGHLFFIRGKKQSPFQQYKKKLMIKFNTCVDEYKKLLDNLDANQNNNNNTTGNNNDLIVNNITISGIENEQSRTESNLSPQISLHSVDSENSLSDLSETELTTEQTIYMNKRRHYEMLYDMYYDMLQWLRNGDPGSWIHIEDLDNESLLYRLCNIKLTTSGINSNIFSPTSSSSSTPVMSSNCSPVSGKMLSAIFELNYSYLDDKTLSVVDCLWKSSNITTSDDENIKNEENNNEMNRSNILVNRNLDSYPLETQLTYPIPINNIEKLKKNILFENAENWSEEQLNSDKPIIIDILKLLKLLRSSIIQSNKNYNELYQIQDKMWDLASKFYTVNQKHELLKGYCGRKQCTDPAKLLYSYYKFQIDLNIINEFRDNWKKWIEIQPSLYGYAPYEMNEISIVMLSNIDLVNKMIDIIENKDNNYSEKLQNNMKIEGKKWLEILLEIERILTSIIDNEFFYPCLKELYDMIFALGKCCGSLYNKSPVEILQLMVCNPAKYNIMQSAFYPDSKDTEQFIAFLDMILRVYIYYYYLYLIEFQCFWFTSFNSIIKKIQD